MSDAHDRWHELATKLELDALKLAEAEARKRLRWSASGEIGAMSAPSSTPVR